jgi:hypothetical protein
VDEKLQSLTDNDLKKNLGKIAKDLVDGEKVELVCHLLDSDNNLGRSLIIDLNSTGPSNIKQVDHRTIEYIIYKNVRYELGKRDPNIEDLPLKVDREKPRWEESKLGVGNWFSQIQYYKVK